MKKIYKITIFVLHLFFLSEVMAQEEYQMHLKSIDSTRYSNRAFIDYLVANGLVDSSNMKYVSNRNLLPNLTCITCDSNCIKISDTLKSGELCEINLTVSCFNSDKHKISKNNLKNTILSIDNEYPYGALYSIPEKEIMELTIRIDGKKIKIPDSVFANLYNPNICEVNRFFRKIEAYSSINSQYIYIYIYGGNNVDTYFSKLIFDKKEFKTKIVADYISLSKYSSFRNDFIGF